MKRAPHPNAGLWEEEADGLLLRAISTFESGHMDECCDITRDVIQRRPTRNVIMGIVMTAAVEHQILEVD
ncbi:hypothetical protein Pelo_19658 [Pelomyxa schiedti]|nr:hypothetical protein Pelo_19658 [Pelomyxa schiedti]